MLRTDGRRDTSDTSSTSDFNSSGFIRQRAGNNMRDSAHDNRGIETDCEKDEPPADMLL
jgi:hypothetical protein